MDLFSSKSTTTAGPMSEEERALIAIQTDLAKKQLENVNALQPFQQQLLRQSMADLARSGDYNTALDAAIPPEQQAAAAKAEFDRSQRLGPIQEQLLQMQLEQMKRGGAATPEQIQMIKDAADAGIAAGTGDINTQTQRGIGMIADELANSRGLRLSDTPIGQEAALLTRAGNDQIASLVKNMRASQAQSVLNYPLAAQNLQSSMNLNQQQVSNAAQAFQEQLRQQAYQNRLALTGPTSSTGLGLSSVGNPASSIYALNQSRGQTTTSTPGIGSLMVGAGAIAPYFAASDRRLKDDYGTISVTEDGVPLHLYRYKGEPVTSPVRLGVMADELRRVNPSAVHRDASGFDVVDYSGIGLSK